MVERPGEPESDAPRVFLSSVFEDIFSGERIKVPLRKRIIDSRHGLPVDLWAYELFGEEGTETPDADTIVERCFRGAKDCDLFVFLASQRHGSHIPYVAGGVPATFLELELLVACLWRKPILVLHLRGQDPDPALVDALVFFRTASSSFYCLGGEDDLYERFTVACDLLAGKRLPISRDQWQFVDWLSTRRSRQRVIDDISDPSLVFLDRQFLQGAPTPDISKVEALLTQVTTGLYGPSDCQLTLPHGAAMFRLWSAMRELMGTDERVPIDPASASLWDRCLGRWAAKTSWLGLHGHAWMGPLAAVNGQMGLRSQFSLEPAFRAATDVREPSGARASAVYSIAHRVQRRERKLFHYQEAVSLATKAIEASSASEEGARSIRGHAALRLARLGRVWNLWSAKEDFSRSLELRVKRHGADSLSAGEGMVDLGLCCILTGAIPRGYSLMQEGLDLLRKAQSADEQSFLMRGLRQFELASRIVGRRAMASAAREEIQLLVDLTEAFDQLRSEALHTETDTS